MYWMISSVIILFRFRNECADGKLTKQHLKTLFEKVFPDGTWHLIRIQTLKIMSNAHPDFVPGNASKITTQIFRIFDSDGNDFLDFKEFLMAIDIANRTTGDIQTFCSKNLESKLWNVNLLQSASLSSNRWGEAEVDFPAVRHGQQRRDRHGGDDRHHRNSWQHRRGQTRCWDKKIFEGVIRKK